MDLGDVNALTSGHVGGVRGKISEEKTRNVLSSFVPFNGVEEETKTFL